MVETECFRAMGPTAFNLYSPNQVEDETHGFFEEGQQGWVGGGDGGSLLGGGEGDVGEEKRGDGDRDSRQRCELRELPEEGGGRRRGRRRVVNSVIVAFTRQPLHGLVVVVVGFFVAVAGLHHRRGRVVHRPPPAPQRGRRRRGIETEAADADPAPADKPGTARTHVRRGNNRSSRPVQLVYLRFVKSREEGIGDHERRRRHICFRFG
jgi:hypothetical protein